MLYHGTTLKHALRIIAEGFKTIDHENWTVSDQGVYFWCTKAMIESGEIEEDEDPQYRMLDQAYSSATCALAHCDSGHAVVFEIDESDLDLEDDVSCENMAGAVVSFEDVPASAIRSIHVSPNLSMLRACFIQCMMNNDLANQDFTDTEKSIAALFSDFYFEQSDFELEETTPEHLSTL